MSHPKILPSLSSFAELFAWIFELSGSLGYIGTCYWFPLTSSEYVLIL